MAVAFDATLATPPTIRAAPTSPQTETTLTVGAGANRVLLVLLQYAYSPLAGTGASAVAWDSAGSPQAMTLIRRDIDSAVLDAGKSDIVWELWGLIAPTSGNRTLQVTFNTTSNVSMLIDAASFTGADQTSVATAFTNANFASLAGGGSSTASVTITSATGNMVAGHHINVSGVFSATSGTNLYLLNTAAANYDSGAASVAVTATITTSKNWGSQGVNIAAAGAGGLPPGQTTLDTRWQRGATRNQDILGFTARYNLNLIGKDQLPGRQFDFPNPRGAVRSPDYTWTNRTPLGAPAATLPPGQFTFDTARWPRGPQRLPDYTWTHSANPATIPQPQSPAKITFDWPNPRGAQRPVDLLTWVQTNTTLLNAGTPGPFVPIDWPNPRAPQRSIDLLTWAQSNPQLLAGALRPFIPNDWPNPQQVRRVIDLITWTQSSPLLLFPTVRPVIPIDWPNPAARPRDPNFYSFTLFNPNLTPPTPPPVTPPGDPVGAQLFNLGRRSQTFVTRRTLPPSDLPATHVFDWPNPRGALRSYDLLTWISIPPKVIPQPQSPAQITFDWPNPRGPLRARDYTHINMPFIPNIPTAPPPATVTFDWPNPRGPLFPSSLRGFIHTRAPLLPTENPPIRQYDWPNPRGALRSVLLYTWIVPTSPGNAPVPVANPALMLKNEVVRVRYLMNDTVRVRYLTSSVR